MKKYFLIWISIITLVLFVLDSFINLVRYQKLNHQIKK